MTYLSWGGAALYRTL